MYWTTFICDATLSQFWKIETQEFAQSFSNPLQTFQKDNWKNCTLYIWGKALISSQIHAGSSILLKDFWCSEYWLKNAGRLQCNIEASFLLPPKKEGLAIDMGLQQVHQHLGLNSNEPGKSADQINRVAQCRLTYSIPNNNIHNTPLQFITAPVQQLSFLYLLYLSESFKNYLN